MKVKDAVASALTLLGRADLVSALSDTVSATAEGLEVINTLVYCFNAVEDELARKYIPLTASDDLYSPNTRFYYTTFTRNPVRVKRVTADGKNIKFETFTLYMRAEARNVTVEYEYAPSKKTLGGDSDYGEEVGVYLMALGMAAEYSIINGEAEMAEKWENKYHIRLDGVQRTLPQCEKIPPRRWV